jgi:hypothetical protein
MMKCHLVRFSGGIIERIPYTRVMQYLTVDGTEYLKNTMMKYHGIVDMFFYLKTANDARKHRTRKIVYVS